VGEPRQGSSASCLERRPGENDTVLVSPYVQRIACVKLDLAPDRRPLAPSDRGPQARIRFGPKTCDGMRKRLAATCMRMRHKTQGDSI